jgi:hypothetical protein
LPRRRAASYLAPPPRDLRAFPVATLAAGAAVHRVHAAGRGPWYFNSSDAWRFAPVGRPDLGACYLAERPVTGLLESFKGVTFVAEEDVARKAHFSAALDRPLRLADLCAAAAGLFGVNGEVHSTTDYERTQAWATALADHGFDGVRYLCRADPGMQLVGYALFDAAGEAPAGRWPAGEDRPLAEAVLREAEVYGLRIRPTP